MARSSYLAVLPAVVALSLIELYPLLNGFYLSVTDFKTGNFLFLESYTTALTDSRFQGPVENTLFYAITSTVLCAVWGMTLAFVVVNARRRRGILEYLLLVPIAVAPISAGVIWAPSGVWDDVNTFWHFVLGQPFFDVTKSWFLYFPIMTLSESWEWAPVVMLVSLSVLSSVPREAFEAAELLGASRWQVFRRISLPAILTAPAVQFILLVRFMDSSRAFEIPFAWSSWLATPQAGAPSDTLSLALFKLLTIPSYGFPLSFISAAAMLQLGLSVAVALVLLKLMGKLGRV